MKILFLLVLYISPCLVFSQTVYESLISLDKTYAPWFGKKAANLTMDYIKKYELEGKDTSYHVVININTVISEQVGTSIGVSLFSSALFGGSAVAGSASYVYHKEAGVIVMGFHDFQDLYMAMSKTFRFIKSQQVGKKIRNNSAVIFKSNDIVFGGEYDPKGVQEKFRFYIQIDQAVFSMTALQFEGFAGTLTNIKKAWEKIEGRA